MIFLAVILFFADSVGVDTTKADTLMLKSAFIEQRMQQARIDTKTDSILLKLKDKATLEKVRARVKK